MEDIEKFEKTYALTTALNENGEYIQYMFKNGDKDTFGFDYQWLLYEAIE